MAELSVKGLIWPVVVAAAAALALAGCGGSTSPSVASVATTTSSSADTITTTAGGGPSSGRGAPQSPAQMQQRALKYAQCMRTHGVPNFPDPSPGGGFVFQAGNGVNPSSPAMRVAQAKCQKYMGGSLPGPGTVEHPAANWLAQMVKAAGCMRKHGFPDFPDPRTSVPATLGNGVGVISDIDGVIFLFPQTIDIKSPQFLRAATICAFPHH